MNGAGTSRRQSWMVGIVGALLFAAAPLAVAGTGSIVATPVGASGSTVYMSVTNAGLEPASAKVNVSMTSSLTTLVGSTSVALAPMSTAVVPVSMSGTVSKLSLSTSLKVSIVDTDGPFCQ